jgi:hypothetical protein
MKELFESSRCTPCTPRTADLLPLVRVRDGTPVEDEDGLIATEQFTGGAVRVIVQPISKEKVYRRRTGPCAVIKGQRVQRNFVE